MNWETYTAFGDSITIGARTYLGYPEYAGTILENKLAKLWNIINHSVSGFTTIDLVRMIDQQYINLKEQKSSITTILIGTNDIKKGVPTEEFEIALNQLIIKAKILTQNSNVILIQIPKFQKGIMYPYTIEMNTKVQEFNDSIDKLAKQHQLKTIAIQTEENDFMDGVHLNSTGVKNVGNQIAHFILGERGY